MNKNTFCVYTLFTIPFSTFAGEVFHEVKKCYGEICLEKGYCPDTPPTSHGNKPNMVDMNFEIENVMSVDSDTSTIGVQLSLRMTWMDNRVTFKNESLSKNCGMVSVPSVLFKEPIALPKLWIPTLWFEAMTNFNIISNFEEQSYLQMISAKRTCNQTVGLLQRHDATAESANFLIYQRMFQIVVKCSMKYSLFPFDKHICYINVTSGDLNANMLKLEATPLPSWKYNKLSAPHNPSFFDVSVWDRCKNVEECQKNLFTKKGEPWSMTGFKLEITRRPYQYVYRYYVTSALCVIASWVSFVIPPNQVDARVAVFVTMFLVLITIFNGVIENTPTSDNASSAIVIWMLSMILFVFVAFLGYFIILYLKKGNEIEEMMKKEKTKNDI